MVPMTTLISMAWLLVAIPLGVAALLLVGGKATDKWGHWLATLAPLASFALGLVYFVNLQQGKYVAVHDCTVDGQCAVEVQDAVSVQVYQWVAAGSWSFDVSFLIDHLSILFVLLITGVGGVIHIYSLGYMAHDPNRRRFFAYLNLFIAAMLILVLADDYLVLFVGWEGVGLCSYLLISFWQEKPSAAAAGKKAFIVNRVGDLGLLLAIFTMLALFGSSSFAAVDAGAGQLSAGWAAFLGFALLVGACGKSAQVPLQTWLLDAMEGPTPVSALIHAATMVTAGVYLVVRSGAIYAEAPVAQVAVALVGTVTLLFGAWIGCAKDDIKKVLAGSTMSQIGYMMLAAGIGPAGYAFAIFHLLTHGFFKANMFLGAGSVMHGTNDDVDMRHYGGLAKVMRITFLTFGVGYLAIIGVPFFSGAYSKDHIIEAAFEQEPLLGVLALIGAGVTAFYMTRLMLMTFLGQRRWRQGVHPHESPPAMVVPLVVLAIGSFGLGMVLNGWIGRWLAPIGASAPEHASWLPDFSHWISWVVLVLVAAGVLLAWLVFGRAPIPDEPPKRVSAFTFAGRHDLFFDEAYVKGVAGGTYALGDGVAYFDDHGVDRAVDGLGQASLGFGGVLRKLQNGYVRSYGLTMLIGLLAAGVVLILTRLV
ncbi:MAG: NADH-quinone oxidoreductase subunit L [Propionibacteriaceae bacterium]|jgi:NADH-quinone oxidoreductase subunit L|nr:NADH-quinone oxidoreductase subunit L [Propionibacteriaceae bacterium]